MVVVVEVTVVVVVSVTVVVVGAAVVVVVAVSVVVVFVALTTQMLLARNSHSHKIFFLPLVPIFVAQKGLGDGTRLTGGGRALVETTL